MAESIDIQIIIKETVQTHPVVLFMKGTKGAPQCGFSGQVVHALSTLGVDFQDVNILESDALRQGIKQFSNWPTIPQLYIKGEFIGGCDIITEMHQSGDLQNLLVSSGCLVE